MAIKAQPASHWRRARAVLRGLGVRAGLKPGEALGPEFLIAAVAKVAGQGTSAAALEAAGVQDAAGFLAAVPDACEDDLGRLPEYKADTRLALIIRRDLTDFVAGKAGPDEALRILLEPRNLDADARRFLADPEQALRRSRRNAISSTHELVQALASYYQRRFHYGWDMYSVDTSTGHSAFLRKGKGLAKAADGLLKAERTAVDTVFASGLYERSPLGACRRDYGEIEAHIVGAALLGEMRLVANGPVWVSAIAWTISPVRYHRLAGLVRRKVAALRDDGLVVVYPDSDEVRLFSQVLAAEPTMDEWLAFLRDADPIGEDEVKEMLNSIY